MEGNDSDGDGLESVQIDLGRLDITSEEISFDEVDDFITENLQDELVKEALERGVDLRQYARQVEQELHEVESSSLQDYLQESKSIAHLHNQIQACDRVLQTMEQMLGTFQSDLGNISSEIQTLQEQSLSMNVKLKNRKAVHANLSSVVKELVVPPDMIMSICEMDVNDVYLQYLMALSRKVNFAKSPKARAISAYADVSNELELLRLKATDRVRTHLLARIHSLRKPKSNIQLLQQNTLVKFRYFYQFLREHSRPVAEEVMKEYKETMGKIYFSYFKVYVGSVTKLLADDAPDKTDMLGSDDGQKKGFFGARLAGAPKNRSAVFALPRDGLWVLQELEVPVIVPHSAQQQGLRFAYTALFRSINYLLLDNASSEYLFISDFFGTKGQGTLELFFAIFGKTLAHLLRSIESQLQSSFDSVALLTCIRMNHEFRLLMARRRIPCLDRYFERLVQLLWPRFKHVLDLNIESVQAYAPAAAHRAGDVHPHFVTRRYADFAAAFLLLNRGFDNVLLTSSLERLRLEMENFILRLAAEFVGRKEQLVFLINNYDLVLSVLQERLGADVDAVAEGEAFQRLLVKRTQEFVEEQLSGSFGGMIEFVKRTEPLMQAAQKGAGPAVTVDERALELLVRGFASDWRKAIDTINGDVIKSFANFNNGTAILQAVLTQLILYYQRFQNVLAQAPFKGLPIRNELINTHHIMVEVKKHRDGGAGRR